MAAHSSYQQGLIPQIPGLHAVKLFLSGGCLPICSTYDNMIWILFYTRVFFVPVRLFFFLLSLIVVLPCMCRPSLGYVVVKTLLGARRNTLKMTRPFLSKMFYRLSYGIDSSVRWRD